MINSNFITRYTTALYEHPGENSPRFDEFRDMFSTGQLDSKCWLIKEVDRYSAMFDRSKVLIVGSWFGTLGLLLKNKYPSVTLTMMDIDPRCKPYVESVMRGKVSVDVITADMFEHRYTENIVINTSCEHIANTQDWLKLLPKGTIIVLQSNNFYAGNGHVNCVDSIDMFKQNVNIKEVWYAGQLVMPMYTRFMIIGKV